MTDNRYKKFRDLDLEPIMFSVVDRATGPRWSLGFAREVETWYRRFLYLCALYPEHALVPCEAVDEFWHTHILDTLKYHKDCDSLFGFYLHHFPYVGLRGRADRALLVNKFAETLNLYKAHFGDDPVTALLKIDGPARSLEAAAAVCAGTCEKGTKLNISRHGLNRKENVLSTESSGQRKRQAASYPRAVLR